MSPTLGHGKVCYLEMPATDVARSAQFYEEVFGWRTQRRADGTITFTDAVGQVSGVWVTGVQPASSVGILIYIMVDDAVATLEKLVAHGGEISQPIGAHLPEITARFRDPAGNLLGLYQNRGAQ
jgi:predicted enzyme related to lactoylglutathione lyase